MKKQTKTQIGLTVMIVLVMLLLAAAALAGCVNSQERDNPCDPAVVTPTPE